MGIGSSDILKHSTDLGVSSHSQYANKEKFAQDKAREAKIVMSAENGGALGKFSQQDKTYKAVKEDSPNMEALVDSIKDMAQLNIKLSFDVSDVYKENIVKVVDQGTGELVRQIPTEEFLEMSKRIQELLKELGGIKGALVNREI